MYERCCRNGHCHELVSQSCFYHVQAVHHIRGVLELRACISPLLYGYSFSLGLQSTLSCYNPVLYRSSAKRFARCAESPEAEHGGHVVTHTVCLCSVDTLRELHWLPIPIRCCVEPVAPFCHACKGSFTPFGCVAVHCVVLPTAGRRRCRIPESYSSLSVTRYR